MNKNLLALLVLLVLVAVTAQFTRQGGKRPEWVAFENDMMASLQLLWEQPGQGVRLREMDGGAHAVVGVRMPANSPGDWNYALVRFVAGRHPAVNLLRMDVYEAGSARIVSPGSANAEGTATDQRRAELMSRQAQANLGGRGLLLLDLHEESARPAHTPPPLELKIHTEVEAAPDRSKQAAPYSPSNISGKAYIVAPRPARAPEIVTRACLVVLPEVSPEEVDQAVKSLNLKPERGDQIRVVKLPPL